MTTPAEWLKAQKELCVKAHESEFGLHDFALHARTGYPAALRALRIAVEALEEMSLEAYPDSDKASLFEWSQGRAMATLAAIEKEIRG